MATHIYHYNVHSEKRFFFGQENRELYDLIAINGNIVSHTPAGVAAFVATAAKEFFIDPQTHIFQHATIHLKRDISDKKKDSTPVYEFKPSIKKLANDRLKAPFSDVIRDDKPLSYRSFKADDGSLKQELINSVCTNVLSFQENTLYESLDDEEKEFIGGSQDFSPAIVIAPYFYLEQASFREWMKIASACYRTTKEMRKDKRVFFHLVLSKDVLGEERDAIASAMNDIRPDGILLWLDSHIEQDLTKAEIKTYIKLLKELRASTDTIYNRHGGALSVMLCHKELGELLNGVGHAVNYGESRSVVPVGGGIPMARFYFPSVRTRLRYGDAVGIAIAKQWLQSEVVYRENICSCRQCVELIKKEANIDKCFAEYGKSYPVESRRRSGTIVRLDYPTTEAKRLAAYHYLYNKGHEFHETANDSLEDILSKLKESYDRIQESCGGELVRHLVVWENALRNELKGKES